MKYRIPNLLTLFFLAFCVIPFVGCGPADDTEDSDTDGSAEESPENTPPTANQVGRERTYEIELGDPSLTAGIPGTGPLSNEQIQEWVDDPDNHATLDVSLPFGLSRANSQIVGLEANRLTRAKIELGRQLYFDTRLSSDGSISCAECHHPNEGFTRHTRFGVGVEGQEGNRNSPISYNRILSQAQFWDGRAESLEAQAKGPIENPIEHGITHEIAVATVSAVEGYGIQFTSIFPEEGVTIDTIARAIASFERAIVTGPTPIDHYERVLHFEQAFSEEELDELAREDRDLFDQYHDALEGSNELTASAKRGRALFFSDRIGCVACHAGANYTDEQYHNLGVGMDANEPDLGRFDVTNDEADQGAFKTPTCRNVALTAPYMHDGSQATLLEVVEWYAKGGHANPHLSDKIKPFEATEEEKNDLVAFLEALTGEFPPIETERLPE